METPASAEPGSRAVAAGDPWKPADGDAGDLVFGEAGEPAAGDAAASQRLASSSTRTTMAAAAGRGATGSRESISFTRAQGGPRVGGIERERREEHGSGGGKGARGRGREILHR
jgi:hypothetical protein